MAGLNVVEERAKRADGRSPSRPVRRRAARVSTTVNPRSGEAVAMERSDWLLGLLLGGIHFTFHLFMRLVPPLIPVLVVTLGLSLSKLGLLVSTFFVGSSVGLIPMGVLSDAYDRRLLLAGALTVVAAGYGLFAAAPALGAGLPSVAVAGVEADGPYLVMALGMVVAGLGTSAHVPVGVPLLTSNVHPDRKGRMLGIWGGSSKLGDAAGPALVGALIIVLGWRAILGAFAAVGVLAAVALFVVLTLGPFETRPAGADASADGAADDRWPADRRRFLYPMVVLMAYFAAYNVVVQGVVAFTPTFVTDVYGYELALGGLRVAEESFADFVLSALLVAGALSRFAGGYLTDRFEHRQVLVGSLAVAAVALAVVAVADLTALALVVALVVFGTALWGNSPARDTLISDLTPAAREGRTFSYLWTASRAFGALSPALVGLLADGVGIRTGFEVLAVATGVAAAVAALLFSERVYAAPRGTGAAADR